VSLPPRRKSIFKHFTSMNGKDCCSHLFALPPDTAAMRNAILSGSDLFASVRGLALQSMRRQKSPFDSPVSKWTIFLLVLVMVMVWAVIDWRRIECVRSIDFCPVRWAPHQADDPRTVGHYLTAQI
jgi:hypothetical protein